jgi:hypothetical protein
MTKRITYFKKSASKNLKERKKCQWIRVTIYFMTNDIFINLILSSKYKMLLRKQDWSFLVPTEWSWSIKPVFVLSWFFCFSFWNDWLPVQTVQRHVPLIAIYSSEESVCFERPTKKQRPTKGWIDFFFISIFHQDFTQFASNAFNVEFVNTLPLLQFNFKLLFRYKNFLFSFFSHQV